MADDVSHVQKLNDEELLTYFNSCYPHNKCWEMLTLS
jgi:hypothetical protein